MDNKLTKMLSALEVITIVTFVLSTIIGIVCVLAKIDIAVPALVTMLITLFGIAALYIVHMFDTETEEEIV